MFIGSRVRELRKAKGLTQQDLADMINVTKVSVCCYEKGTRIPSLDTIIDISNLFKVNIDYLIGHDIYVASDDDIEYGIKMSKEEIELVKELRKHIDIYVKLIENPKRTLELIEKKVR